MQEKCRYLVEGVDTLQLVLHIFQLMLVLCTSCSSSALHARPLQLVADLGTHAQPLHFVLNLCSSCLSLAARLEPCSSCLTACAIQLLAAHVLAVRFSCSCNSQLVLQQGLYSSLLSNFHGIITPNGLLVIARYSQLYWQIFQASKWFGDATWAVECLCSQLSMR
ncbi:hypothetical protein SLEP1_g28654 [Rubroshorea leprosula]|uniref:Secreted protein n=1 Tax=Rubroshorea leprosula TaxID=152421 RepID=A0AAV5K3T7_9ROSI|nr:hypothetical protein SLEP1_g28654 [Rubroshorea leprosula]